LGEGALGLLPLFRKGNPMAQLTVGENVRHVESDGRAVLLDLRSEAYFVLDPVATEMWGAVTAGQPREEAIRSLGERYDVEFERLAVDYDAFLRRCCEDGFLSETPSKEEAHPIAGKASRRFPTFRAWWSLFRTSRRLRRDGFARTYRSYARIARPASSGNLEDALNAFAAAENFYALKRAPQDCLPRSLALFRFLRNSGIPAQHRIGVRLFPFLAHAWVEVDGRVVHDDPSNPQRYATIAKIE